MEGFPNDRRNGGRIDHHHPDKTDSGTRRNENRDQVPQADRWRHCSHRRQSGGIRSSVGAAKNPADYAEDVCHDGAAIRLPVRLDRIHGHERCGDVRLGARAIFFADEGHGLIDRALELAIVFKCSPEYFLDLDEDAVRTLYDRAVVALNRLNTGD